MQEEKNSSSLDQETQALNLKVGEMLFGARNRAALNRKDISEQINLPITTIEALEKDQFEKLPESTYVRGYLRSYARLVGLDPEEIVNNYNALNYSEPEIAIVTSSKPNYDSAFLWSTAAVLTILVGLLVTWWIDVNNRVEQPVELANIETMQSSSPGEVGEVKTEKIEESLDRETITRDGAQNNEIAQTKEVGEEILEESVSAEEEESGTKAIEYVTEEIEQAMEEESQDPKLVTMSAESENLTVTFVEKSWTEIRDADSNTLMQGLIEPGVVKSLNGKPPFHIFLGNSPGVVIEVNGQYFDQSQFNRGNRTARFKVSGRSFN